METCKSCKFWREGKEEEDHEEYRQCRKHTPQLNLFGAEYDTAGLWPTTHRSDWCSEHEACEQTDQQKED